MILLYWFGSLICFCYWFRLASELYNKLEMQGVLFFVFPSPSVRREGLETENRRRCSSFSGLRVKFGVNSWIWSSLGSMLKNKHMRLLVTSNGGHGVTVKSHSPQLFCEYTGHGF